MGAGLPAIAVGQLNHRVQVDRHRRQASSHIDRVLSGDREEEKARFSWNRASSMLLFESVAFESEGHTLAATDAQRCQAFLGIALDHFVQQRHQHTAA